MKKLIFATSLFILCLNVKAQEMNFEETVSYLQGKMKEYGRKEWGDDARQLKVKKDGTLEFGGKKTNFFYLNNGKNEKDVDEFGFKRVHPSSSDYYYSNLFFMDNGRAVLDIAFENLITVAELERIYKAFRHLRSLCTKEKDPFDN